MTLPAWPGRRALAISALVKLVRQEYPAGLSLHEIAATWGEDITREELDALREFPEPAAPREAFADRLDLLDVLVDD